MTQEYDSCIKVTYGENRIDPDELGRDKLYNLYSPAEGIDPLMEIAGGDIERTLAARNSESSSNWPVDGSVRVEEVQRVESRIIPDYVRPKITVETEDNFDVNRREAK